jgi:hypothetical protein
MLNHPERLLAIAVFLLLFGCVTPFLMVSQVLESTFFLNFLSFGASVSGLFLGIIGIAMQRLRSKKKDEENYYE